MDTIRFDFSELAKLPDGLSAKIRKEWVTSALTRYGLELEMLITREINNRRLNVSGEMRKSVKSLVHATIDQWILGVGTSIQRPFPYPVAVHEGTRPHWPPVDVMRKWVRQKLNVPKDEVNKVAFLVSRKISKQGTDPQPFMRTVFIKERNRMATKVAEYLAAVSEGGKL